MPTSSVFDSRPIEHAEQPPLNVLCLFCIGLSAGLAAALFPRVSAMLAIGESGDVTLEGLSIGYCALVFAFSVLIGLVTVWMNWRTRPQPEPKIIFTAALSVPALLSGAVNANSSAVESLTTIADLQNQIETLHATLERATQTPEVRMELGPQASSDSASDRSTLLLSLIGIGSASAGEVASGTVHKVAPLKVDPESTWNLKPQLKYRVGALRAQYLLSLYRSGRWDDAIDRAEALSQHIPALSVVQDGEHYRVVHGGLMTKTDALVAAARLRDGRQVRAQVIRVPKGNSIPRWSIAPS